MQYIYAKEHICMHTCMNVRMHMHIFVYIAHNKCILMHMYVHMHMYIYMYLYMCISIYIYLYIYIYTSCCKYSNQGHLHSVQLLCQLINSTSWRFPNINRLSIQTFDFRIPYSCALFVYMFFLILFHYCPRMIFSLNSKKKKLCLSNQHY